MSFLKTIILFCSLMSGMGKMNNLMLNANQKFHMVYAGQYMKPNFIKLGYTKDAWNLLRMNRQAVKMRNGNSVSCALLCQEMDFCGGSLYDADLGKTFFFIIDK